MALTDDWDIDPLQINTPGDFPLGKVSIACGGQHIIVGTRGNISANGLRLYSLTNDISGGFTNLTVIDSTPPGPVRVQINNILIPTYDNDTVITYQLTNADKYRTFIDDSTTVNRLNFSTDRISGTNYHVIFSTRKLNSIFQSNLGNLFPMSVEHNNPYVIGNFNGTTLDFY